MTAALTRQAHVREYRRQVRDGDRTVVPQPGHRMRTSAGRQQHSYRITQVWQRPGQLQVYSRGLMGNTRARGNAGNADARRRMAPERAQAWGKRISETKIRKRDEVSTAQQRGPSDMPRAVELLSDVCS